MGEEGITGGFQVGWLKEKERGGVVYNLLAAMFSLILSPPPGSSWVDTTSVCK